MIRRFLAAHSGATAVEFAIVAPIFLFSAIAVCAFALFAWRWSIMDSVATATARCVAISSPDCSVPDDACSSTDGGICFALHQSARLGFPDMMASEITISHQTLNAGIPVVRVEIHHDAALIGYTLPLSASASFPVP